MIQLTPVSVTSSLAYFTIANQPASGTIILQYGARPDFKMCVAPTSSISRTATSATVNGLNPGSTYYFRAQATEDGVWSNTIAMRTAPGPARNVAPSAVMIDPALIVIPEPVLSLSAGNEIAGFPVDNLIYDGPVAWRSQSVSGIHSFTAETGATPIDTIALLSSNASPAAQVTINAGDTLAADAVTYGPFDFRASPNLPGRPGYHGLFQLPAAQTYRYWEILIDDASLLNDVFHLEHAVLGKRRVTKNHAVGKTETGWDLGTFERSRDGNPIRTLGARGRTVDFDLSVLSEAQYEVEYGDLNQRVGSTEPVLVLPNSKQNAFLHDRILYGPIRGGSIVNPASPYYTRSFTIDSVI